MGGLHLRRLRWFRHASMHLTTGSASRVVASVIVVHIPQTEHTGGGTTAHDGQRTN
jgi:hypothetical protein